MTGPLMSSTESASEKRNELLTDIEDQLLKGVYKTDSLEDKKPDPITGVMKTVKIVKISNDKNNIPIRAEEPPLKEFGIRTFNLSINEVKYAPEVEKQIQEQQAALMKVQIAVAQAKEAEQNVITTSKQGEAKAATAKWEQEVFKAKAVTTAEQELKVAELGAKTAEQYKRKQILEGEGEAEKRKLIMAADNALSLKLEAFKYVHQVWAASMPNYKGNLVPVIYNGTGTGGVSAQGSVMTMADLVSVKLLKDLGLDLSLTKVQKEEVKK